MKNELIIRRLELARDYMNLLDEAGYQLIDMNMVEPFHIEDKRHHSSTIIFEKNEQLFSIRSDWTRSLLNYNENYYLSHRFFGYFGPVVRNYKTFYQAGVELYRPSEHEVLKSIDMHLSFAAGQSDGEFQSIIVNDDKLLDLYIDKYQLDSDIRHLVYEKNISEIRKRLGETHPLYQLMAAKVSDQINLINGEFGDGEIMSFINHLNEYLTKYHMKFIVDLSFRSPQSYYNGFYFQVFLDHDHPLLSGGEYNSNAFGIALNLSDGGLL
ncbi:ATP phosphoribosyltransferase regulatory subunit [Salinicoccus albus]|uniref:ATP phosphoribosyltransferase regulatory subunit n=1 Tax=Salinicoccus albus TaxID=418756 RepID=UPI00036515D3|nr:ATP phosphoribosyltransferase regulatory subunit [Salinicoccus albus]